MGTEKTLLEKKWIGRLIKSRRVEIGWAMTEVALKAGINYSYLSKVENGRVWPGEKNLLKILNAMGFRVMLVGGIPPPGGRSLPDVEYLEQTTSGSFAGIATAEISDAMNKERSARALAGKATTVILSDEKAPEQKKSNKPAATGFSRPLVRRDKDGKKIIE